MPCQDVCGHTSSLYLVKAFSCFSLAVSHQTWGWGLALACLLPFAIFVNMAEGTSYGIVPYMIPTELPVVSAMVGAGGTLGALIVDEKVIAPPGWLVHPANGCTISYSGHVFRIYLIEFSYRVSQTPIKNERIPKMRWGWPKATPTTFWGRGRRPCPFHFW